MSYPVVQWEIGGPDAKALREFYDKAFGWRMSEADPDYTLVDTGDDGVPGGIMQAPAGAPPYATLYIRVEDLVATLERVIELGGVVVVPPTELGRHVSFALFADPQGAVVGLLHTEAGP